MAPTAAARFGGLALSLFLGLMLCASKAQAQPTPNFDAQRYLPAGNYHGFLVVPEAQVLPKLKFGFDVQLDFAFRPLQKLTASQSRETGVIDALFAGHARVGFAPADWVQIDAILAFMQFARTSDGLGDIGGNLDQVFSLGDLWLQGRFRLLKEEKHFVSVAVMPFVTFPTGNPNLLLTSGVPTFGANAMISRMIWRFRIAASIGYRLKLGNPGYKLLGDRVAADDELLYSGGVGFQVIPDRFDLNLELFGTGIVGPGRSPDVTGDYAGKGIVHSPLEALVNARVQIKKGWAVVAGVGWGITTGIGTPAFRVIAGVSYAPSRDQDGDGIVDNDDECPAEPEDFDEFEDADGCPEPDNDLDGIADLHDGCPNDPEDKDGWNDEDGCPDPDNDGDGFLDGEDKCPDKPEDVDGWQDGDGCPDPDNDGDGFLDVDDLCPDDAENVNKFKDDDGCPDDVMAVVKDGKILILEKILFVTAKDVILKRSYPILEAVKQTLLDNPRILKVRIEGHTDDRGSDKYNQRLSEKRANAILRYLVKGSVDPDKLMAVGYGEARPIDTNKTAAGRERNRRVEFTILETEPEVEMRGVDLPIEKKGE